MTIQTPSPIDRPDWRIASSYATELYFVPSPGPGIALDLGSFYIADAPAFAFVANVTGGPWELEFTCNNEPPFGLPGFADPFYQGSTDCLVHDNIPTPAPWITLRALALDHTKPIDCTLQWWQSQTQQPGALINFEFGLAIDVTAGACPAGQTTNFASSLLLPGIHQWCFDVNADLDGIANLSGYLGGALKGRMVRLWKPLADLGNFGQVIVSNVQPVWQVVNSGGALVTCNASLTKGF